MKIAFFTVTSICKKTVRDIEITYMNSYYKNEYGLSDDTKISPTTKPLPLIWETNNMKNREKLDFPHSSKNTVLWCFSDQQFSAAKLLVHMLRRQIGTNFVIDNIYNDFIACPRWT